MGQVPQKQTSNAPFAGTVEAEQLTVEYWHKRFKKAFTQYESFVEMADELAVNDTYFAGAAGVLLLQRVQVGRAKLVDMVKSVQLMETLRPVDDDLAVILRRQNLVAPEN